MKNRIALRFDNTLTRLAGYDFGEETFKTQVEGKFDSKKPPITIAFPDNIIKTSSSFVQGFFEKFVVLYGFKCIGKEIIIDSKSKKLKKQIKENIY